MPEGKEIGKAYVTVNLDDQTAGDYDRIKTGMAGKDPLKLKTQLEEPADTQAVKERIQSRLSPVKVKVDVDDASLQDTGSKVDSEVEKMARRQNQQFTALGVAAALGGLPTVAAVAAAGTAAALGGVSAVFAGIAATALKNNADVTQSFASLRSTVVNDTQAMATPLAGTFVGALDQVRGTFQALEPQIATAMSGSARDVGILATGVTSFAREAMPGFVTAVQASGAPVQAFAGLLTNAGVGVTDFFRALSTGSQGAAQGMSVLGNIVREAEGFVGQLLANIASGSAGPLTQFQGALRAAEQAVLNLTQSGGPVLGFMSGLTGSASGALAVIQGLSSVLKLLPADVSQLVGSVTAVTMVMQKFGVDATSAFKGIGPAISEAEGAMGKLQAGVGFLASAAMSPATLAVGALSIGLLALGNAQQKAADEANQHAQAEQALVSALRQSNGAIDDNVRATEAQTLSTQQVADSGESILEYAKGLHLSLPQVTDAALGNADAMKAIKDQLQGQVSSGKEAQDTVDRFTTALQGQADAAGNAQSRLAAEAAATSQAGAATAASAQQSAASQQAAAGVAQMFGMSLNDVASAFGRITPASSSAGGSVQSVSATFIQGMVAVKNAEQGLTDYFTGLQQKADQANQALSSANHSYQQSIQSVADAQHSYVQAQEAVAQADQGVVKAQQALVDANANVGTAERSLAQAQWSEQQAQQSLTQARKDAVQQLKDLRLQLDDQVTAEQRAQLQLFTQTQTSAALGVTPGNAQAILAQATTTSNVTQKQSALDLISAENSLADTLNTGAQLRDKVNTANQQGVNGNPAVVSATQALSNAQDQVSSSEQAVVKAQQAVMDAQAGVVRAQQAVTDAVYAENTARRGITDAIYNEQQALQAVRVAQLNANQATQLNTTSLDLNTQAGRNNWAQLQTLYDSYPAWMDRASTYNGMIQDTARFFGGSTQAAADFLKQQGKIPQNFQFGMTAVAYANFDELNRQYSDKFGGRIGPVAQNVAHAFAEGGHVKGPGGPTSDSINARLSNNEFVQPADAVDHYGVGFMQAIQQKKLPKGGDGASLPGFASGGLYQGEEQNYFLSGAGVAYQTAVDTLGVMGFPAPPGLPVYVPPPPDMTGAGGAISYAAGAGVAQWVPQILQALAALGQPASWLGTVERRMQQESSGDPNSINTWDINWQQGHPSKGLMQTIQTTFDSYRNPAWSPNIYDPLNNIYAGLNYALHTYGSLDALNRPGGYDSGGYMLDNLALNSTGKPEMVLPPNLTNTLEQIHSMVQSGQGTGGGGPTVHVNVATMPADPYETAQVAARELAWALRNH